MNSENRNLILAIALSMAVLFGWQVFIVGPELERETARQQAIAEQMAASDAESRDTLAATTQGTAAMPAIATDEATAVADAPRITIDAPLVSGSISLAGLRFDDVVLKGYQETQEEDSPNIQLLQRTDTALPYFVEFRWTHGSSGTPQNREVPYLCVAAAGYLANLLPAFPDSLSAPHRRNAIRPTKSSH